MFRIYFVLLLFFLASCATTSSDSNIVEGDNNYIDYDYIGTWVDLRGNIVLDIKNNATDIIFYDSGMLYYINSINKKTNNEYILYLKDNKNIFLYIKFYSDISSEIFIYSDNSLVSKLILDKV